MSILIKGMEMPLRCINCPFKTYYHGNNRCLANRGKTIEWEIGHDRGRDCPLVPLPEGHGDLIEKKSAREKFCQFCFWKHQNEDACERCAGCPIDFIPTIVPAEGGGEE